MSLSFPHARHPIARVRAGSCASAAAIQRRPSSTGSNTRVKLGKHQRRGLLPFDRDFRHGHKPASALRRARLRGDLLRTYCTVEEPRALARSSLLALLYCTGSGVTQTLGGGVSPRHLGLGWEPLSVGFRSRIGQAGSGCTSFFSLDLSDRPLMVTTCPPCSSSATELERVYRRP